jgi:hypothetical protein
MLMHPYKVLGLKFGVTPNLYQSIVIFSLATLKLIWYQGKCLGDKACL